MFFRHRLRETFFLYVAVCLWYWDCLRRHTAPITRGCFFALYSPEFFSNHAHASFYMTPLGFGCRIGIEAVPRVRFTERLGLLLPLSLCRFCASRWAEVMKWRRFQLPFRLVCDARRENAHTILPLKLATLLNCARLPEGVVATSMLHRSPSAVPTSTTPSKQYYFFCQRFRPCLVFPQRSFVSLKSDSLGSI